jgi:hypothetical protein
MNPIRAWNRFWFGPISARSLGVFRIVFGLLVLVHLGFQTVDLDYWFTGQGLLQGNEALRVAGRYRFSPLLYIQDPLSVRLFMGSLAAIAVAFALGWHARVASILLYLGLLSLYHRNISTNCGPDLLLVVISFYMMFSPCGATMSLDARRVAQQRGTLAEPLVIPWAQRLLQIQLSLIYFCTALDKARGSTWPGGTAIHYVLFNREVRQFNLEWLGGYPVLISALTHAALVLEFSLAFLLWFRPTRRWIALLGVFLHAGIFPLVNVPLFGEQMTALYLVFLDHDEMTALGRFLNPLHWFRRRPSQAHSPNSRRDRGSGLRGFHQLEFDFDARALATGNSSSFIAGASIE